MHTFLSALLLTAAALIGIGPAFAGDEISVAEQRVFLDAHL